ncbi:MAG: type III pantothenate kinase [Pirellulales bacterium]|nr:type III pantothenate kinase [Pirellulales bacterium]
MGILVEGYREMRDFPLIAVDIGNSRSKFALFEEAATPLPVPVRMLELPSREWDETQLLSWLGHSPASCRWEVASVNRPATESLFRWLQSQFSEETSSNPVALSLEKGDIPARASSATHAPHLRLLSHQDLPLVVAVEHPERVGIDRLLGGVGANRLRPANMPAIVIDLGTALTIDYVDAGGAFQGGAILPGIGMSARALHDFTDLLPLVPLRELAAPPGPLGKSTIAALRSGLYWGAIGGMKEVIAQLSAATGTQPQIFLTGGAAPAVAASLHPAAIHVPHLILGAIASLPAG